jgi:hypothetical protein
MKDEETRKYASARSDRLSKMRDTTNNILSVARVQIVEGQLGFERNIIYGDREPKSEHTNTREGDNMQTLDNTVQRAALSAKDLRIQQMESWIVEAISKPAMPRELRMEGLEMVQDISPTARQAVERICPSLSRSQGRELEIER